MIYVYFLVCSDKSSTLPKNKIHEANYKITQEILSLRVRYRRFSEQNTGTTRIYGYMTEKFPSVGAKAIDFRNFFMEINLLSLCTRRIVVCAARVTHTAKPFEVIAIFLN